MTDKQAIVLQKHLLLERMLKMGFQLVDVIGDGHCQFRAVAYQLYGSQESYAEIRKNAVIELSKHPEWKVNHDKLAQLSDARNLCQETGTNIWMT